LTLVVRLCEIFLMKFLIHSKGNDHLVMLTVHGELYTSGCGEQGQLGRVAEHFANRGGRKGLSMYLHVD